MKNEKETPRIEKILWYSFLRTGAMRAAAQPVLGRMSLNFSSTKVGLETQLARRSRDSCKKKKVFWGDEGHAQSKIFDFNFIHNIFWPELSSKRFYASEDIRVLKKKLGNFGKVRLTRKRRAAAASNTSNKRRRWVFRSNKWRRPR